MAHVRDAVVVAPDSQATPDQSVAEARDTRCGQASQVDGQPKRRSHGAAHREAVERADEEGDPQEPLDQHERRIPEIPGDARDDESDQEDECDDAREDAESRVRQIEVERTAPLMQREKDDVRGREDRDEHARSPVQGIQHLHAADRTLDRADPARQDQVHSPRREAEDRGEIGDALQRRRSTEPVLYRIRHQPGEQREQHQRSKHVRGPSWSHRWAHHEVNIAGSPRVPHTMPSEAGA